MLENNLHTFMVFVITAKFPVNATSGVSSHNSSGMSRFVFLCDFLCPYRLWDLVTILNLIYGHNSVECGILLNYSYKLSFSFIIYLYLFSGESYWYQCEQVSLLSAFIYNIDGLVQDCSNSIANTLEFQLLQSCTKHRYVASSLDGQDLAPP